MNKTLIGTIAVFFAACNNTEFENRTDYPINLNISIEAISKAPNIDDNTGIGNFNTGDETGLLFSDEKSNYTKVMQYRINETSFTWKDLDLPSTTEKISISGCYPYNASLGNKIIKFDADGNYPDLLIANPLEVDAYTTNTINLTFFHAMSRLNISYTSKDGSISDDELETIETTCYAKSVCDVDIEKGYVDKNTATGPKYYKTKTGKNPKIIVVPQTNNGTSDIILKIKLNEKTLEYVITQNMESKKQLNVNINIKRTNDGTTEIDFSGFNIGGWEDNGTVNGTVDI